MRLENTFRKKGERGKGALSPEFLFAALKQVPTHPLSAMPSQIRMLKTVSESKLFQGL